MIGFSICTDDIQTGEHFGVLAMQFVHFYRKELFSTHRNINTFDASKYSSENVSDIDVSKPDLKLNILK